MSWVGWLDQATGALLRVATEDEPTPEYSEKTHARVILSDEELEKLNAGGWDPARKEVVDVAPVEVKPTKLRRQNLTFTEWLNRFGTARQIAEAAMREVDIKILYDTALSESGRIDTAAATYSHGDELLWKYGLTQENGK